MAFDPTYAQPAAAVVFFERRELERLLRLYGRMVAAGEWRLSNDPTRSIDQQVLLFGLRHRW